MNYVFLFVYKWGDKKHLFFDYQVSRRVWATVQRWVGRQVGGLYWNMVDFMFISNQWKKNEGRDIVRVIWLSKTWNL